MTHKILILGGTTEARLLAGRLAARADLDLTLSLAGRTESPVAQPVPVRVGGFGGAGGLAAYLKAERVDLLIDATHPHAATISANAAAAALQAELPILALRRPAWRAAPGDDWTLVANAREAIEALGDRPRRVFLALGRQEIRPFEAAPQHFYLIRSVDPIEPPLGVPDAAYVLSRGPFSEDGEAQLLQGRGIDAIVCKNSGGRATFAKIAVARRLGIPVVMFQRPELPDTLSAADIAGLLPMIDHVLGPAEKRGV